DAQQVSCRPRRQCSREPARAAGAMLPDRNVHLHQSRASRLFFMSRDHEFMNSDFFDKRDQNYPIIVHSHLRWDGVWQRPQQFLSRLSRRHRIVFVEGPTLRQLETEPTSQLLPVKEYGNVTVMRTFFPESRFHDGDFVDS